MKTAERWIVRPFQGETHTFSSFSGAVLHLRDELHRLGQSSNRVGLQSNRIVVVNERGAEIAEIVPGAA